VQPVSRYQGTGTDSAAIGEHRGDPAGVFLGGHALPAKVQRPGRHGAGQFLAEVQPVHGIRAVRWRRLLAAGHPHGENLAVHPVVQPCRGRGDAGPLAQAAMAELIQHAGGVAADRDAGPGLPDPVRLLEYPDFGALPDKGRCRGKPADPCPDNRNVHRSPRW
jgi:hypothetical protein